MGEGKTVFNQEKVSISEDGMQAYIYLSPKQGETIKNSDVIEVLKGHHVEYGIKEDMVTELIEKQLYNKDILIAEGATCENGIDGYYEYLFESNIDIKPKILEDGSVDYRSMGEVPVVEEGTELVHYIPATVGTNGSTVKGTAIPAKRGRDLPQLKGKGFTVSEDKTIYHAAITGKASLENGKLIVSSQLVIKSDVTTSTGDIHFAGDVVIRGNVLTGSVVRALGNISVDGHVEAVQLAAGKDVVLKHGMQGGGKGLIEAGGNVSGKFFEQVKINAKGNVLANAIMNSEVVCKGELLVSGRRGVIVGGNVSAQKKVRATLIGNMAETKTKVQVGGGETLFQQINDMEEKITEVTMEVEKCIRTFEKLQNTMQKNNDATIKQKSIKVLLLKRAKEKEQSDLAIKKEELLEIANKLKDSRIIVEKTIYGGVTLNINGASQTLKTQNYNVTYLKKDMEITFVSNI